MNEAEKEGLLREYLAGPEALRKRVGGMGPELLDFRPEEEGAWTIREHVIHVADSDINGFVRLKSIVAQPGSTCYVMEEEGWTARLAPHHEEIEPYLEVMSTLRGLGAGIARGVADWEGDYFVRTYKGETLNVTLALCLGFYVKHLSNHLPYIDRNESLFLKDRQGM
jgi:hypothetical protein